MLCLCEGMRTKSINWARENDQVNKEYVAASELRQVYKCLVLSLCLLRYVDRIVYHLYGNFDRPTITILVSLTVLFYE